MIKLENGAGQLCQLRLDNGWGREAVVKALAKEGYYVREVVVSRQYPDRSEHYVEFYANRVEGGELSEGTNP